MVTCVKKDHITLHTELHICFPYIFSVVFHVFVLLWKEGMAQCQRQSCPLDIMINTKLAMAFNQFRNKLFVQSTALVLMPHATTETFEANEIRVWQRPDIRQQ